MPYINRIALLAQSRTTTTTIDVNHDTNLWQVDELWSHSQTSNNSYTFLNYYLLLFCYCCCYYYYYYYYCCYYYHLEGLL